MCKLIGYLLLCPISADLINICSNVACSSARPAQKLRDEPSAAAAVHEHDEPHGRAQICALLGINNS